MYIVVQTLQTFSTTSVYGLRNKHYSVLRLTSVFCIDPYDPEGAAQGHIQIVEFPRFQSATLFEGHVLRKLMLAISANLN